MSDEKKGPPWRDERELRVDASPEQVFDAWAKPERVRQWFADDARIEADDEGDALVHVFENFGEHRYRIVESVPGECLVLDARIGPNAFRQEIRIRREDGETVLSLIHSGFGDPSAPPESSPDSSPQSDDEQTEGIDSGWVMAFAVLRHYLENHFGQEKTTLMVLRPARFDYRDVRDGFFTGDTIEAWLPPAVLGPTRPETLATSSREVALLLPDTSAVLELKAFGMSPESRVLGVRLNAWGDDGARLEELRPDLEQSVERLRELL